MNNFDEQLFQMQCDTEEEGVRHPSVKVLVVDDDEDVHAVTDLVLSSMCFEGKPLALLHAYSAAEAINLLKTHTDIAVVLLDVVMETENSGLQLVKYIRDVLKQESVRIILRTGQPGVAPGLGTITTYDINDYRNKSDLTRESLLTCLYAALRNYRQLQTLEKLAYREPITGLLNRNGLLRLLTQVAQDNQTYSLVVINIDHFALVNGTWGALHGDMLLRAFAARLTECDIQLGSANLGADTFALLVSCNPAIVESTILSLLRQRPLEVEGVQHSLSVCAGIARIYPKMTPSEAVEHGYVALRHAKSSGTGVFVGFKDVMLNALRQRIEMLNSLESDLKAGRLFLVYQPQVNAVDGKTVGVEALIRWKDKSGSLVSPAVFIELAEQSRLIHQLGLWVIETSIREVQQAHQDTGLAIGKLAVNVSAVQLSHEDFAPNVASVLRRHKYLPSDLDIEVTESLELEQNETVRNSLRDLKALGCKISIDDFGTGYSSLSYLDHLHADYLKVDRSFVAKLAVSATAQNIVSAIVSLAKSLNIQVIAEGVEDQYQAQMVSRMGCQYVQGFLFAKPMPIEQLKAWLTQ